jgi:hypothetical protein
MKFNFIALVAVALSSLSTAASAEDKPTSAPASAICIVPLLPPSEEARGDAPPPVLEPSATPEVLPGMPSPLLTLKDRPGRWIVNADRRLVLYDGFWPVHSYLDKGDQAREPWSSRTVAVTYGGGVSVLPPGAARFEKIPGSHEVVVSHGMFEGPFVLPHRKETVVAASDATPYRVEDKTLVPWLSPQEMSGYGGAGIARVYESRFLGGEVVLDNNGRLSILTDDNHWREVMSLGKDDWGEVADAPKSGVAIFLGYHAAVIAPKPGGGYTGWKVDGDSHAGTVVSGGNYTSAASFNFYVSKLFGEAFYFGRSWLLDFRNPRWLRVTPKGFDEIEGSSRVVLSGSNLLDSFKFSSVHDLDSIHRILFQGRDGLYLYDGNSIVPIPNSGPDVVGAYPKFLNMPALGRSLVVGLDSKPLDISVLVTPLGEWQTRIFEVTPDGRLEKVSVPRSVWGLQEWPQAHVGLAWARDAVYTLNTDLTFVRRALPRSSEGTQINYVSAPNPETGDVLISSSAGLFLAVTGAAANEGACHDHK